MDDVTAKVHGVLDERWNVGHDDELTFVAIGGAHYECGDETIAHMTDLEIGHPNIEARARLAACAPEALRLLLDMHQNHGDRATFDWAYWFTEIEKVLDKAGIAHPVNP